MGFTCINVFVPEQKTIIRFHHLHQSTKDHMFYRKYHLVRLRTGVAIWFNAVLSPLLF